MPHVTYCTPLQCMCFVFSSVLSQFPLLPMLIELIGFKSQSITHNFRPITNYREEAVIANYHNASMIDDRTLMTLQKCFLYARWIIFQPIDFDRRNFPQWSCTRSYIWTIKLIVYNIAIWPCSFCFPGLSVVLAFLADLCFVTFPSLC